MSWHQRCSASTINWFCRLKSPRHPRRRHWISAYTLRQRRSFSLWFWCSSSGTLPLLASARSSTSLLPARPHSSGNPCGRSSSWSLLVTTPKSWCSGLMSLSTHLVRPCSSVLTRWRSSSALVLLLVDLDLLCESALPSTSLVAHSGPTSVLSVFPRYNGLFVTATRPRYIPFPPSVLGSSYRGISLRSRVVHR